MKICKLYYKSFSSCVNLDKFKRKLALYRFQSTRMTTKSDRLADITNSDLMISFQGLASGNLPQLQHIKCFKQIECEKQTVENSFFQYLLPLETSESLKNNYRLFDTKAVRTGRLLEVLDQVTGFSAYNHCGSTHKDKVTCVTVSMNDFKIFKEIQINQDLLINVYPTWVGNSTIQIRSDLYQKQSQNSSLQEQDGNDLVASGYFLFAARLSDDHTKSFKLPKLPQNNDESQLRFEIAEESIDKLKSERNKLSHDKFPNPNDMQMLHILLTQIHQNSLQPVKDFIPMSYTQKTKTQIMHVQDRNVHGRIFGGYIMRESVELGWLTAKLFAQQIPTFEDIDDVQFLNPVEIGSILESSAKITITNENYMRVAIKTTMLKSANEEVICTKLNIIFRFDQPLKNVYPMNYIEGLEYLDSKKHLQEFRSKNF